jgi:hypothetical protein
VTPSGVTPSEETPSGATPSGATPSGATPSGATPSRATLSGATLSGAVSEFKKDIDEVAGPKKKSSSKRTRAKTTINQDLNQNVEELSTGKLHVPPKRSQIIPNALPTQRKSFIFLDYMHDNQGK